jgi:amino acid transporter
MNDLRRELGARDLTLFAIASIIGVRWIAAAAHAGPGSIVLWLLAALLFMMPLSVAVAALTARDPCAGGIYQWTRRDFGPWHGFLCFWTYWISMAFWFPGAAMFYMSATVYTMGPHFQWLADNRAYLVVSSLCAIWIALGTNIVGMKIGKWTENTGAVAVWILALLLGIAAWAIWNRRGPATRFHLMPDLSWGTINFWASIAYGITGMEAVGMIGSEIRDPERSMRRAAWAATIFTTVFYAGTTMALLVVLRPEAISDLNGLAQTGEAAGAALGAGWLAPLITVLMLCSAVGQFGGLGSAIARMPFAAGADGLLPPSFARVHPRWATPYVSMIVFGLVASALLIALQLGDTARAAYQTIVSLMVITGFLPFIYVFGSAWKLGCRLSSIAGWFVTALAIGCSLAPTTDIQHVWLFELKLMAGTAAVIGSAFLVYRRRIPV